MNLPRRTFLKNSLAATASAAFASHLTAASTASVGREYYELRCYHLQAGTRLKADANPALLDAYLERALLPALEKFGVKNVGVFSELEVQRETATGTPKPGSPVWLLIPHASLESFVEVSADLNANSGVQLAGPDQVPDALDGAVTPPHPPAPS